MEALNGSPRLIPDVGQCAEIALKPAPIRTTRVDEPLQLVRARGGVRAADERAEQHRTIADVMVGHLGDGAAEALAELRGQGLHHSPLLLQAHHVG